VSDVMIKYFFLFLVLISVPQNVAAHVLDEYLQSAQISLTTAGVKIELHLTPGVDVADRVFAAIDRDRNDQLSPSEQQAYAERVLHDLTLELDGQRTSLVLDRFQFPSKSAMQQGDSLIQIDLSAATPPFTPGDHQLTFLNNHWPQISVYQANVLLPSTDSIKLTTQQRDRSQHLFELNFHVTHSLPFWTILLLINLYRTILPT